MTTRPFGCPLGFFNKLLIVGVVLFLAGLLLMRDWFHSYEERSEEQGRRKAWKEEVEEMRRERDGN